jgi:hypothetical protein
VVGDRSEEGISLGVNGALVGGLRPDDEIGLPAERLVGEIEQRSEIRLKACGIGAAWRGDVGLHRRDASRLCGLGQLRGAQAEGERRGDQGSREEHRSPRCPAEPDDERVHAGDPEREGVEPSDPGELDQRGVAGQGIAEVVPGIPERAPGARELDGGP